MTALSPATRVVRVSYGPGSHTEPVTNLARFTVNGLASSLRGVDLANGAPVTLALEAVSSLVQRATFEVYNAADSASPLASKDAPSLSLVGATTGPKVDAATPAASVTATLPASGAHSYMVRCTVNGGLNAKGKPDANLVFERVVAIRTAGGRRKVIASEGTQYEVAGWAGAQNDDADALEGGGTAAAIPAPALVATSNIPQTGNVVVDGVATNTLAAGEAVLCTAQTDPTENGPKVVNNSGSWTDPPYYDSNDDVAAALGQALAAVKGGTLGAGSVWAQRTGATLAGAKTFVKLPDAADKAVVTCLMPSGDTSGATDTARINAALAAAKAAGGGTVQLANTGPWYVNADLVCEGTQGVYLIGSCGGASGPTSGTRLIRVGGSAFNTGHRAFTQPAVAGTVTVTVDSTAGMVVGMRARTRAGVSSVIGQTYIITAIGAGTVTLRNDGATGNDVPGASIPVGFLRSDEAIVQMRSTFACAVRDLQIQAASPTFSGKAVNFDGSPYASDGAHNDVWDCTIITAAFSALPTLVRLNASTHPAASLTGTCGQCLDLLVHILSGTTYKYSTDGGRTWDENSDTSPITITTSRAFPGTSNATGLTLNLPAGAYVAGYQYRAQQGIQRGVDFQSCFDCDTWARFDTVLDGVYASGVSNTITGTGLGVDGYLVTLRGCNSTIVDVAAEPGGVGYGRGGIWADDGRGNRYALAAGDNLTGGSWIWLQNESSPILQCTTSQNAGAAISLYGCGNVKIRGFYSASPAYVFDSSRAGATTLGVTVEDVEGFTWDGVTNTLFTGAYVGNVTYWKDSQKSISNAYLINSAQSYFGLVNGPGTQGLVAGCTNVGGQRSTALTWGGNSGAALEILNNAHGYGDGLGYYPPQNVTAAGHAFLVRDSAATNGQRPQLRVGQLGVCLPGTALTLANGANNDLVIKSSYVEIAGPTGAFSISGFVADANYSNGQILRIVWTVQQALTITHDAVSGAGSRILTPTAANVVCATPVAGGFGFAEFQYSTVASRWRLLGHT